MNSPPSLIDILPPELLEEILFNLELKSILNLSSTNTVLYNYIHANQSLWRHLCAKYEISGVPSSRVNWKDHFMQNYPKARYIQQWLDGEFSNASCCEDSPSTSKMFALDVDTWGRILDAELARK